jgi:hypothetical protein
MVIGREPVDERKVAGLVSELLHNRRCPARHQHNRSHHGPSTGAVDRRFLVGVLLRGLSDAPR